MRSIEILLQSQSWVEKIKNDIKGLTNRIKIIIKLND